jgi:hypothetical protein
MLRALRSAATARVTLIGWNDGQWQDATRQATDLENVVLQAALSGGTAPGEST